MDFEQWKKKNEKSRKYAHFDYRVSLKQSWEYINSPINIKKHGFYPFIHYTQIFRKYNKKDGIKNKKREIYYSAHLDRYIYSLYGYKLNCEYNKRVLKDGIDNVSVAYRNNLKKNNIHFAKEAIDFIRKTKHCHIVIGDFTNFFDRLDHKYLKYVLCDLLGEENLPNDYYAVYKNITKFSYWALENILKLQNLCNKSNDIKKLNSYKQILEVEKFKINKRNIITNNKSYGIPQGSAISAVLSNIYMLHFDKLINGYILAQKGLYIRYSDDFIIITPSEITDIEFIKSYVNSTVKSIPNLELQEEKTQMFEYHDTKLVNKQTGQQLMNYLGFTFDGKAVTIRDKTISKYYYRMHRKIKGIVKGSNYTKHRISNKVLYEKYSIKGAYSKKGNFLTYVERAKEIFGAGEAVDKSTKNHMKKIKKRISNMKNKNSPL